MKEQEQFNRKFDKDDLRMWERAAFLEDRSLRNWVRKTLNDAARKTLQEEELPNNKNLSK